MRALLGQRFQVAVVKDAAARVPEGDGYTAALVGFRFLPNGSGRRVGSMATHTPRARLPSGDNRAPKVRQALFPSPQVKIDTGDDMQVFWSL